MIENLAKALKFKNNGKHVRLTDKGLFLKEFNLDHLARIYHGFLRGLKIDITYDGSWDRILNLTGDEVHYLVDPYYLWTGYVLPGEFNPAGFLVSKGTVLSCREQLLVGDPKFENHGNVELLGGEDEFARFLVDGESHVISKKVFETFYEAAQELDPDIFRDKREAILELYGLFERAYPKKGLERQVSSRDIDWSFTVNDKVILGCTYEHSENPRGLKC